MFAHSSSLILWNFTRIHTIFRVVVFFTSSTNGWFVFFCLSGACPFQLCWLIWLVQSREWGENWCLLLHKYTQRSITIVESNCFPLCSFIAEIRPGRRSFGIYRSIPFSTFYRKRKKKQKTWKRLKSLYVYKEIVDFNWGSRVSLKIQILSWSSLIRSYCVIR